jgi:hypothetical protein
MSNLFSLNLWFTLNPGPLQPVFQNILVAVIVLLFVGILVSTYFHKRYKKTLYAKLWLSGYNFCLTGTIIGALLLFFTYERVNFLSARFWFLIWFLLQAAWAWFLYKKLKRLPVIKKEITARKEFEKYIP